MLLIVSYIILETFFFLGYSGVSIKMVGTEIEDMAFENILELDENKNFYDDIGDFSCDKVLFLSKIGYCLD